MAEATINARPKMRGHVLLTRELKRRGWNQTRLAAELEVNTGVVTHVVKRDRGVGLSLAMRFKRVLGIPVESWHQAA